MFTSIIDKVLAVMLALAVTAGAAAIWYADHEHAQNTTLQQKVDAAAVAASQAAADIIEAQQAASAAQAQLAAAKTAAAQQAASAAQAAAAASTAHAKLAALSAQQVTVKQTLDTQLPKEVWDAVYNSGK